MTAGTYPWERPLGATPVEDGLVEFRVWAPRRGATCGCGCAGEDHALAEEGVGVRAAVLPAAHRRRLRLVLDGAALPDPCSRWQPDGLRGPSRVVDPRPFAWTASRPDVGARGPRPLRAARRHVHARGDLRRGDRAPRRAARARRHRDRADAGRRVPRPPRLGLRRRLPLGGAVELRRPGGPAAPRRRRPRGGPRGGPRRRLQPPRGSGRAGDRGLRPLLHRASRDARGAGPSTSTTPTATPCASGCCRTPSGWVRDFGVDGLRLDAIHAIYDESARHVLARAGRPRARGATTARSSSRRATRTTRASSARHPRGASGYDAHVGRRLPPRAARARSPASASGYYDDFGAVGDLAKAFRRPLRPRRAVLELPPAALRGAAPTTAPPRSSSSSPRTTTRSATARSATACRLPPGRSPPS